ncbi:hypothetical protein [Halocola ammonii]
MKRLISHRSTSDFSLRALFKSALALAFVTLTYSTFAQQKYEKEVRIEESEVPEDALELVNSMKISSKIKWYKEYGLDRTSFEAKTKFKGERLSIEFSEDGTFEDLEIQKEMNLVEAEALEEIEEFLEEELEKYSVKKIQFQYLGETDDVLEFFLQEETDDVELNYEIVLSTKVDGSFIMFEYLFDEEGDFIRKSKIILKMSDNIEY